MSEFYKEWQLISIKVKALQDTSDYLFSSLQINSSGAEVPMRDICSNCKENFELIYKFKTDYGSLLPAAALICLERSEQDKRLSDIIKDTTTKNGDSLRQHMTELLVKLILLESNLSYHLGDTQIRIQKAVEIAFSHLQGLITVDKSVGVKWKEAKGEVGYEALGGVHLLWHKIWAFKANSQGERTDLILSELINSEDLRYQSADGLVLTEWKVVKNQQELQSKIEKAKEQAKRYKRGSLASLELSNYCYLVMVSEQHLKIDNPLFSEHEITYRVINIAYSPKVPSKS